LHRRADPDIAASRNSHIPVAGGPDWALAAMPAPASWRMLSQSRICDELTGSGGRAMSTATSVDGQATGIGSAVTGQVIASYSNYAQAQRAVDYLSDASFPVEHTSIVGRDLSLVEQVTGRMTSARATLMGAASGAWFGLFIGLFIGLFAIGPVWLSLIIAGLVIGAIWGAIFGFVAHWTTRGQRDFSSTRSIVAARYEVSVADAYLERAQQLLSSLG
jgi:hypothetical protein